MRFEGRLHTWHADSGLGTILPLRGGDEILVHISGFARGNKPEKGDLVSFEIERNPHGVKRAAKVTITPRARGGSQRRPAVRTSYRVIGNLASAVGGVVIVSVLVYGGLRAYRAQTTAMHQQEARSPATTRSTPSTFPASETSVSQARCDGRTYCSQMTSCAEAKFFLNNCPGVKMDGNNDGVPCEQQWCTSPFSR